MTIHPNELGTARNTGVIVVLMGGDSAEREVSLKSGKAVLQGLLAAGVNAVGLDTRDGLLNHLQAYQPDCVFLALHGRGGEDGAIQGFLDTLGIPYTGSGVAASALAMDKIRTKQLWRGCGLPTPDFFVVSRAAHGGPTLPLAPLAGQLGGLPLMIKPASEGSSVGVTKVTRAEDLESAWQQAAVRDTRVLLERFIAGEEYSVAILNGRALPIIHLEPEDGFYDYHAKYLSSNTRYHCPCGLAAEEAKAMQDLALQAFAALGGKNWGRVDIMRDGDGQCWLLEANTIPGMTDHSLVPMAAKAAGLDFPALLVEILAGVRTPG